MATINSGRTGRQDAFRLAAEAFCRDGSAALPIAFADTHVTLSDACDLVWNSRDIFPGGVLLDDLREVLGFKTRTYAAVARAMKSHLQ